MGNRRIWKCENMRMWKFGNLPASPSQSFSEQGRQASVEIKRQYTAKGRKYPAGDPIYAEAGLIAHNLVFLTVGFYKEHIS
jgi:hypothetical protein